jgi:hypothetical protein
VNHQCTNCRAVLPPERRSPLCLVCWPEWQRSRNRDKVRVFRNRAREARANPPATQGSRPPNAAELAWLDWLNLGLAEPVRQVQRLIDSGRPTSDPEVVRLATRILERYDSSRDEFEARARPRPDCENLTESWRGYFESVRRLLQ